MGEDFPAEEVECSKCGKLMLVEIRRGDCHHWADCDAGETDCQLIKDAIEANDGQSIDVSVTNPE